MSLKSSFTATPIDASPLGTDPAVEAFVDHAHRCAQCVDRISGWGDALCDRGYALFYRVPMGSGVYAWDAVRRLIPPVCMYSTHGDYIEPPELCNGHAVTGSLFCTEHQGES